MFGSKSHRSVKRGQHSVIETLESRRHLSASAPTMDANGIVQVTGTRHADHISIGLETDNSKLDVTVNGVVTTFNTSDVKGVVASGGNGKDDLEVSEANGAFDAPVTLVGGNGNDILVGGSGDDVLSGQNGKDKLAGGAGNDSLAGGRGNDSEGGGAGDDNMSGGAGNDSLDGGDGNDAISGGRGSDHITGDAGDDNISGGAGDDNVDGGAGVDNVSGGGGVNVFHSDDSAGEQKDKHADDTEVADTGVASDSELPKA